MRRSVVTDPGLHSEQRKMLNSLKVFSVLTACKNWSRSFDCLVLFFTVVDTIKWKCFFRDTLVSIYFVWIFCYRQKNVYDEQLPVLKVEGLITFLAFENIYCHGSPWCFGMLVLSDCIYIFLWLLSALKSWKQKAEMKPEAFRFYYYIH